VVSAKKQLEEREETHKTKNEENKARPPEPERGTRHKTKQKNKKTWTKTTHQLENPVPCRTSVDEKPTTMPAEGDVLAISAAGDVNSSAAAVHVAGSCVPTMVSVAPAGTVSGEPMACVPGRSRMRSPDVTFAKAAASVPNGVPDVPSPVPAPDAST
jgi:hypothetical protein